MNHDYHVMGAGFTWETQDKEQDIRAAQPAWQPAWQTACKYLSNGEYDLVILDELNIILKHQYLDLDEVITRLQQRPTLCSM